MSKKWFSGPPPSVGWWPASDSDCAGVYRWWNGSAWSIAVHHYGSLLRSSAGDAALDAEVIDLSQGSIKWQHRPASWPERSKT